MTAGQENLGTPRPLSLQAIAAREATVGIAGAFVGGGCGSGCQGSAGTGVNHQPEHRHPSTGAKTSSLNRSNTPGNLDLVGRAGLEPATQGL